MYSGAGCRTSVFVSIFAVRFKHRPPTPTDCVQVLRWSWGIEVYHRALKQCCGVERAQVRCRRAVWGHLLLALRAFVRLEVYRLRCGVSWYALKLAIIRGAIREYLARPRYDLQPTA